MRRLLLLCLAAATLAGCGNKGPLVLPTKPPAATPAPAPASTASTPAPARSAPAPQR